MVQYTDIRILDLEKAYDTTWKYGILKDLFDMRLKGKHLLLFKIFYLKENLRSVLIPLILTSMNKRWSSSGKHPACYIV